MKKFVALLLALTMVFALAACGANSTPATQPDTKTETPAENTGDTAPATTPEYTIKFATGSTADLENPQNVGTYKFKELVEERSNGRIAVECYINSTLGDVTTIVEQVQMGAIEMCDVENGTMANFVQECALWNLPYLFTSLEEVHKIQESDIGKNIQAQFPEIGIKHLAFNDGGFRYFTNNKHEIASAADFDGLKFRVMNDPLYVSMMESLGASATIIAFAELYTALQQGTVDGQENPLDLIYAQNYFEVQKYLSLSEHLYYPRQYMANLTWFESLSQEDQDLIAQAAIDACAYQNEYFVTYTEGMLDALKEKGMVVTEFDKASAAEACKGVWAQAYEKIGGGDAAKGEEIVNRIAGGEFR